MFCKALRRNVVIYSIQLLIILFVMFFLVAVAFMRFNLENVHCLQMETITARKNYKKKEIQFWNMFLVSSASLQMLINKTLNPLHIDVCTVQSTSEMKTFVRKIIFGWHCSSLGGIVVTYVEYGKYVG